MDMRLMLMRFHAFAKELVKVKAPSIYSDRDQEMDMNAKETYMVK